MPNQCFRSVIAVLILAASSSESTCIAQEVGDLPANSPRLSPLVNVVARVRPAVLPLFLSGETPGSFSSGSGAIIHANGYVVTNDHVVVKNKGYALLDGKPLRFVVVGRSPEKDLAVIRLVGRSGPFPFVPIGKSRDVIMGESVVVLGNPGGRGIVVTSGIVSAKEMLLNAGNALVMSQYAASRRDKFIQYDAAVNRGNSGGPLINMEGALIGIVAAMKPNEQNSNFAIPTDRLRTEFQRMIEPELVHQRQIGLTLNAKADSAIVTAVMKDSAADEAGLKVGDKLLTIDGQPIRHAIDWSIALDQLLPLGRRLEIVAMRNRLELPVSIEPKATSPRSAVKVDGVANGLTYEFIEGEYKVLPDFEQIQSTRSGVVETIDLESIQGETKTNFAIRLKGYIKVDTEGLYRLTIKSDDGSRVRLHDEIFIDHDGTHPPMPLSRLIRLSAGLHPVTIEYFQTTGHQDLGLTLQKLENPVDPADDEAPEPAWCHLPTGQ